MLTQGPSSFKFIMSRAIVLYLACFFIIWRILDYHQLLSNAVPTTMSRLTPPVDYFTEFVDRKDHYDRYKLMDCIYYHKAVADFFANQRSEAYGMLGFCYERLGQLPQAVASYNKAITFNPDYFWPYYNLGVIFYKQGKYAQAEDYFRQAITQSPIKTIVLLTRSKVYNDVKLSKQNGPYDFLQGFKEGNVQAYILLMDSLYKSGSYDELLKTALYGLNKGMDTHGIFYYYAGLASFYQKSYQNAMNFLQIALQIDPHNTDALLYMGMCFKVANKMDMAKLFIGQAGQIHKQGTEVLEQYLKPRVRFF